MITIDGSFGEGGGQILRTSLALSLVTGRPLRIEKIRAGRKKPGLMRQHLTAVNAATAIGRATVHGAEVGSTEITFEPGPPMPGEYHFAVGTAGSTSLVLQTVLPALLTASESSRLVLEGGTHNPFAPPFDFLEKAFLPVINRMGPKVTAMLDRPGFFPAGGGRVAFDIKPCDKLTGLDIVERGDIKGYSARAVVARLPRLIAERELSILKGKLGWQDECLQVEEVRSSRGPGNVITIAIESEHVTEVFTGFGRRGLRAETVAENVAQAALRYLAADVPVGEHLADQLLLPFALAGGGLLKTLSLSRHATTNSEVLRAFLEVEIASEPVNEQAWLLSVKPRNT